ncbi:MAG: putative baseplate assembly protein [Microcystaceae cyanobacterium]
MDFDFLPKLPKSNLDDRTYQELVEECLLRIPRYCPEWTNYNPSDPGITLIELFAWLTDQMLLRFNQVPLRHYIAFLELLGIRLKSPTPATGEITFYLTTSFQEDYIIPAYTAVATPRTETEEAVVFSTIKPLIIGSPQIRHFLTAESLEIDANPLNDRLSQFWNRQITGEWSGPQLSVFDDPPQIGNCYYVVLEPNESLAGNVIALTFKGESATSTGINPDLPPRLWEAWDGNGWQPILLSEADDRTDGLSFSQLTREGSDPFAGADVILHLPLDFPSAQFSNYQGHWLRCCYTPQQDNQPGYGRSPRIIGINVSSMGGTVPISQEIAINNEDLGASDGRPGQKFQLQVTPILPRRESEYLLVRPPEELPQRWQEVNDFADSHQGDRHYTLDSLTGEIQFGPLIREPHQLKEQTQLRATLQQRTQPYLNESLTPLEQQPLERQYGAVPPKGSLISMVSYRTGGGQAGNVQKSTITIVKSAVPYVSQVINHKPTANGANAESLEDVVIRVPRLLRSRNRAVTAEDFENLAIEAGRGAIARARCLFPTEKANPFDQDSQSLMGNQALVREIERYQALAPDEDQINLPESLLNQIKASLLQQSSSRLQSGQVRLLLVGLADLTAIERRLGIHPDQLSVSSTLLGQIQEYLDERRLLGVEIYYNQPNYVGVSVQTKIALEPEYNTSISKQSLLEQVEIELYRFLNPITGGLEGTGWPFGRPVYSSDIVKLLQTIRGIRYIETVQLFGIQQTATGWERYLPVEPKIDPGALGLICSWQDSVLRSSHVVNII